MIMGFDSLTVFQICMVIFTAVFTFRYQHGSGENLQHFLPVPVLYTIWSCVVIYYYSDFFFMTILWFLLGNFLGVGAAFLLRRLIIRLCNEQMEGMFYYPRLAVMMVFLIIETTVLAGIQCLAFFEPLRIHSWVFNELLGFIPGLTIGCLWGMLFVAFFLSMDQKSQETPIF